MKWWSISLACYITLLACMPCADAMPMMQSSHDTEITEFDLDGEVTSDDTAHTHDHEHHDTCTPFCVCLCCGLSINIVDLPVIASDIISSVFQYSFSYSTLYHLLTVTSMWHPPAMMN